ncbi:MAG: GAF and ANTAR domain-containing protein [Jatrophihabitans sp.]|uniref:GAF and ANTAR domain-containing protein n=1 Tax=Jatrophihabitans sp. TaxID=1932789 RepID=UPI003F817814
MNTPNRLNIDAAALTSSLRRLSEPSGDTNLHDAVRAVIDACVTLFTVDGSGLMVADDQGQLRYAVATDGPGRLLEKSQLETGQGPCIDTFVHDRITIVDDIEHDERYPEIATDLAAAGVRAVLGVPVRLGGLPIGSLDVYKHGAHGWDESEREALRSYGRVLEATISAAVAADRAGELADQLGYALENRVPIERGIGFLMGRDGLDHAAAFNRLRRSARSSRRRIGEVAEALLRDGRLPGETP